MKKLFGKIIKGILTVLFTLSLLLLFFFIASYYKIFSVGFDNLNDRACALFGGIIFIQFFGTALYLMNSKKYSKILMLISSVCVISSLFFIYKVEKNKKNYLNQYTTIEKYIAVFEGKTKKTSFNVEMNSTDLSEKIIDNFAIVNFNFKLNCHANSCLSEEDITKIKESIKDGKEIVLDLDTPRYPLTTLNLQLIRKRDKKIIDNQFFIFGGDIRRSLKDISFENIGYQIDQSENYQLKLKLSNPNGDLKNTLTISGCYEDYLYDSQNLILCFALNLILISMLLHYKKTTVNYKNIPNNGNNIAK
ncbi:hypothetical protein AAEX28_11755 [Lentisphaerota bacterium WC36G]|nr:hypothetical protein LJT99_14590 [Lentisphaerae bacterium WC36]